MEGAGSNNGWIFWSNINNNNKDKDDVISSSSSCIISSSTSTSSSMSYDWGLLGYTMGVMVLILSCQLLRKWRWRWNCSLLLHHHQQHQQQLVTPPSPLANSIISASEPAAASSSLPQLRISALISDFDLKYLVDHLELPSYSSDNSDKWEHVISKTNNLLSYSAKCCKPKDGPLKYLSVTVFEDCSPEMLRDFYMDTHYRKLWDKTLIEHQQLQVDLACGTEIGRTIKKFPLLTPREYVLAWRLWEGINQSFYCFTKECEHPAAPRQNKYVRVPFFRSGWRIRKVPGRNACEIKMLHQEDAGLNSEMAKLAFVKGIWSFVCKMDCALRKYSGSNHIPVTSTVSALTLIHKVPPGLDSADDIGSTTSVEHCKGIAGCYEVTHECRKRKLSRRPSSRLIANGLIVLGGAFCLSRGHSDLGAKVAMAYILSKFTKRGASAMQNRLA